MLHSKWHSRWKRDCPLPIWHQEIEDIIVLKNNKGTEDNRVRKFDYSIQISKLFYERFIRDEEISLFSPHDVPGLSDAFGTDGFDDLYQRYESNGNIPRKTVNSFSGTYSRSPEGTCRDWSSLYHEH